MSNSNKKRKFTPSSSSEPAAGDAATPDKGTDSGRSSDTPVVKKPAAKTGSTGRPVVSKRPAAGGAKKTTTSSSTPAKKTTSAKAGSSATTAKKSSTARTERATSAGRSSAHKGTGGAVNAGGKPHSGPQVRGKKQTSSSRAVADARKAASRSKNSSLWLWIGAAVVVVALAVAGIYAVTKKSSEANALPEGFPVGTVEGTNLVYGDDSAPVKVDYWVDLLCPFCRMFETDAAETIEKAVADGDAQLIVHAVGNLDGATSPGGYSTRAGSAVLCAAESDKSYQLMKLLYEEQPAEGGPGLSGEELAEMADSVGADDSVGQCIIDEANAESVATNTEEFAANGYEGTPTVLVQGEQINVSGDPSDTLQAAIDAALASAPADDATATTAPADGSATPSA